MTLQTYRPWHESTATRDTFEREGKLPKPYKDLREEIKRQLEEARLSFHRRMRITAGKRIPDLFNILIKYKIDKDQARLIVTADCLDAGWSMNTIRHIFKDKLGISDIRKAQGAIAANKVKAKKRESVVVSSKVTGNPSSNRGHNTSSNRDDSTPELEQRTNYVIFTASQVDSMMEKKVYSLSHGGKGDVKVELVNCEEVSNITAVLS